LQYYKSEIITWHYTFPLIWYRDKLVKMLQTELECLRGPLNEDYLPSEPPCLIHIWIPSAFLTGQSSDIHHVYQVQLLSSLYENSKELFLSNYPNLHVFFIK